MNSFVHSGDDIYITKDDVLYRFTLAFFVTQEPDYALSSRYFGRIYEPGVKHVLLAENNQARGIFTDEENKLWSNGDNYIDNVQDYINAQIPVVSVEEKRNRLQDRIILEAERRIDAGVTIPGVGQFRTDDGSITRLHALLTGAQLLESADQAVSISFRTSAGNTVTVTSFAQISQVYLAAVQYVAAILQISSGLVTAAESFTEQQIDAYDETDDRLWSVP